MSFNSWRDYENFESDVRYKNRFVHTPEVNNFLLNVKNTLSERARTFTSDRILFRSQIGYEEEEVEGSVGIRGLPYQRMKPTPKKAREGRANSKGIPYLYLSTDENTCSSELRPQVGQYVSMAEFKPVRDLKVVDCYSVETYYNYVRCVFDPPSSANDIGHAIWSRINDEFTKPITNSDRGSDYVATQILAELFRSEGYDGICFKSGLGDGYNITLFDLALANLSKCKVMETKSIKYIFEECKERYLGPYDG